MLVFVNVKPCQKHRHKRLPHVVRHFFVVSNKTNIKKFFMRKIDLFMRKAQAYKSVFFKVLLVIEFLRVNFIQRLWGFVRYKS
jgi:hypothetical protein